MSDDVIDDDAWHISVGEGPESSLVARMAGTSALDFTVDEASGEFSVTIPLRGCITLRPAGMSVTEAAAVVISALFVNAADDDEDDLEDDEPED